MKAKANFAAFIITYERATILPQTIESILSQTYPPSKILIVDNSISTDTEELIKNASSTIVTYYRVGYNAGPAGAAAIALRLLAEEGFDWIYWGDDNDPPKFSDCFEKLLDGPLVQISNIGAVGATGSYLNTNKGLLTKVTTTQILHNEVVLVDTIAGGMCLIVSGKAIRNGVNADPTLFFAFEELDLALSLKKNGYVLAIETELARRYRESAKFPERAGRDIRNLWVNDEVKISRVYYSFRNFIVIMMKHRYYFGLIFLVTRKLAKILINLILKPNQKSFSYFTIHINALKDAFLNNLGHTIDFNTNAYFKKSKK